MRLRQLTDEDSDFVQVNSELNPKLWRNGRLDAHIVAKLKEIAHAFIEFVGIDLDVQDLTLTGSNANYTWTDYSDIDLHVIISGEPGTAARELYSAKKALWGDQHNITIKGLPVECYVQGEDEEHHSTGVYSLLNERWLVEPTLTKPEINDAAIEAKKDAALHEIEAALLSKDLDKMQLVKERIVKMRKAGLEKAGEWSVENLVFKILRNLGLIDELTEKIRELEDAALSLEQTQPLN